MGIVVLSFIFTSCSTDITTGYCGEWEKHLIADGAEYIEGELMVSFIDGVSVEDARTALEDYENLIVGNSFGNNAILVVNVTTGTEIKWKCILQEDENIENVELSFIEENT